jgi:hypothetical protein
VNGPTFLSAMSTIRRFTILLCMATAVSLTALVAYAYCPPETDYSVRGEYERAEFVGIVRVDSVVWLDEQRRPTTLHGHLMLGTIPGGFDPYIGADYHVMPEHTFKGAPAKTLTIFSENTEARTPLRIGERYLVFLERVTVGDEYRRIGDLMIDDCGNSIGLADAWRAISIIEHANDFDRLEAWLRGYVAHEDVSSTKPTRYAAAFTDLSEDGRPEVVVRLSGGGWCGSGGCTMLVLSDLGNTFRVVSRITITQLPIRVLQSKTNGWHDLGVTISGGGVDKAFEARLAYDGRAYATNPSVVRLGPRHSHAGRVLISADSMGDVVGRPIRR